VLAQRMVDFLSRGNLSMQSKGCVATLGNLRRRHELTHYPKQQEEWMMSRFVAISVVALLAASPGIAQQAPPTTPPAAPQATTSSKVLSNVPGQSVTVADWYKQSVYDSSNAKIGEVRDVLLSPDGKVTALIVGVGGFLGIGEKDVAVPFNAIKHETRDGKVYLTMNTTKDELKTAPGLRYDRTTTTWGSDTGSSDRAPASTPNAPRR
jgi:sporulation protein YlmC with PRC-barrel domain